MTSQEEEEQERRSTERVREISLNLQCFGIVTILPVSTDYYRAVPDVYVFF